MTGFHDERRFAPAVREHRNNGSGPTAQWEQHKQRLGDDEKLARVLWGEGWSLTEISEYLRIPRDRARWAVGQLELWETA